MVLLLTGHTLKDPQYTIDYHRGTLLNDAELSGASAAELAQHAQLRREPLLLDADAESILRALESMAGAPQLA